MLFALGAFILSSSLISCSNGKVEGMVATVDGEGITQEEFDRDYDVYRTVHGKQLGEDAFSQVGPDGRTLEEELREDILDSQILQKLISREAGKMNITVTDEEIEEYIDDYVIEDMGGEETYNEFLENNEIPEEFFWNYSKNEILANKHREEFIANINISEEEAKEYYEENKEDMLIVRASRILVYSEEKGKEILSRLKNGEEFEKLAILESKDIAKFVTQGGDVGYFGKGLETLYFPPDFEEATFALEEGETSGLVKTNVGYYIIKVTDRLDTFEELEEDIKDLLEEESYVKMIQELREEAKVEKYVD